MARQLKNERQLKKTKYEDSGINEWSVLFQLSNKIS